MVASIHLSTQEFFRVFIEHCLVGGVHEIIFFALVLRTGGSIFINHHATDWASHHVVSPPYTISFNFWSPQMVKLDCTPIAWLVDNLLHIEEFFTVGIIVHHFSLSCPLLAGKSSACILRRRWTRTRYLLAGMVQHEETDKRLKQIGSLGRNDRRLSAWLVDSRSSS